jgi:hypothetical protein
MWRLDVATASFRCIREGDRYVVQVRLGGQEWAKEPLTADGSDPVALLALLTSPKLQRYFRALLCLPVEAKS